MGLMVGLMVVGLGLGLGLGEGLNAQEHQRASDSEQRFRKRNRNRRQPKPTHQAVRPVEHRDLPQVLHPRHGIADDLQSDLNIDEYKCIC
jgi:hypothetical protein